MQITDPLAFQQLLAPVAGDVRIRPMVGTRFRADITARMLPSVGLFRIEAGSFSAEKEPRQDFYGFTIPLNAPFTVFEHGGAQTFDGAHAHILSPGDQFTFRCKKQCSAMACNFYVDSFEAYRERVLQETGTTLKRLKPRVSMLTAAGSRLFRSVARAWAALDTDNTLVSEIARQEMDDNLLAGFLSLIEDSQAIDKEAIQPADYALKRAQDYIHANLDHAITRDDLAAEVGVSIRSLNRVFGKRHGSGPMAFIRQRRLDACYARLIGAGPDTTSVSSVAMSYGFSHFGKFAMAYKKAFGESPSASLRK